MWKPVKNYEGLYEVSDRGEIRSLPRNGTVKSPRIIVQHLHKSGYMYCCLNKNDKQKNSQVHRVVAEAFIPNPDNKPQVNHINGDKKDNRSENLEWATSSENMIHSFRALGHKASKHGMKPIVCIETGDVYESRRDAERQLGMSHGCILHALKGKVPRAGGLHWAYCNVESPT